MCVGSAPSSSRNEQTEHQVRVAGDRDPLAVHVGVGVRDRVDDTPALCGHLRGDLGPRGFGNRHQHGVGIADADRRRHLEHRLPPGVPDQLAAPAGGEGLQRQRRHGPRRCGHRSQGSSAGVQLVVPVGGRVQRVAVVAQHRDVDTELAEQPTDLPHVADVGVEAGQDIDPGAGTGRWINHVISTRILGEKAQDGEEHRVVAGEVGSDEARRVGVRRGEADRQGAGLLGATQEHLDVVADDLAMHVVEMAIMSGL